ncbi:hypothetical protein BH23GEM3_BH23GEM3_11120 [soil metagenome]
MMACSSRRVHASAFSLSTAHGTLVQQNCAHEADPGLRISRLAPQLDHADHSALSRQILRCFSDRPTVLRQWLGWEGLMELWLRKKEVRLPPPVSEAS